MYAANPAIQYALQRVMAPPQAEPQAASAKVEDDDEARMMADDLEFELGAGKGDDMPAVIDFRCVPAAWFSMFACDPHYEFGIVA
jgi:hypothetical protein